MLQVKLEYKVEHEKRDRGGEIELYRRQRGRGGRGVQEEKDRRVCQELKIFSHPDQQGGKRAHGYHGDEESLNFSRLAFELPERLELQYRLRQRRLMQIRS